MSFDTLSERYEFSINPFPADWLPLLYLYDPDLPLFPLLYFHELDPDLPPGQRPGRTDRVFGYVHHVNLDNDTLHVSLAINKDLSLPQNAKFKPLTEDVAKNRLGIGSPVQFGDIEGAFSGRLAGSNPVLRELWYQVIEDSFGKSLPFGRMWDPVLGLARFVASWNSDGGRKGELIQTHDFARAFGERVATGEAFHADFYLLPTWSEVRDTSNPLSNFPRYSKLISAAQDFVANYCDQITFGRMTFSAFRRSKAGIGTHFKTQDIVRLMQSAARNRQELFDNYSAFNRGPARSVISLMMLHDLRSGHWALETLTQTECAEMYTMLKREGSHQAPKVIQLYGQQCFGAEAALPIDNWVETFLRWPLHFSASAPRLWHKQLFESCTKWGRIERLIWIAVQARKVHSSICSEILWCVRYGEPSEEGKKTKMRGANPLACKLCAEHVRSVCPAFAAVRHSTVHFNANPGDNEFSVWTENPASTLANQHISYCEGSGIRDEYSVRDRPKSFRTFPAPGHDGAPLTVEGFIGLY